jgi:hypothetical protein
VSQAATCKSGPSTAIASNAIIGLLESSLKGRGKAAVSGLEGFMLDRQKTL